VGIQPRHSLHPSAPAKPKLDLGRGKGSIEAPENAGKEEKRQNPQIQKISSGYGGSGGISGGSSSGRKTFGTN
jgi:hypothetical protein